MSRPMKTGAYGHSRPADGTARTVFEMGYTSFVQQLCLLDAETMDGKLSHYTPDQLDLTQFEVVDYKTQVVSGVNYSMTVKWTCPNLTHPILMHPVFWSHFTGDIECTSIHVPGPLLYASATENQ